MFTLGENRFSESRQVYEYVFSDWDEIYFLLWFSFTIHDRLIILEHKLNCSHTQVYIKPRLLF